MTFQVVYVGVLGQVTVRASRRSVEGIAGSLNKPTPHLAPTVKRFEFGPDVASSQSLGFHLLHRLLGPEVVHPTCHG